MQELVLKRVWVEASEMETEETVKYNKIGLHPADIHYYEEYVGSAMRNYTDEPVTTINLYTQEVLYIAMPFDEFNAQMEEYRKLQLKEKIFNKRN